MTTIKPVSESLIYFDRALWIVDNAIIQDLPALDDCGQPIPGAPPVPGSGQLAHEYLEELMRRSPRGRSRRGLTTRLWLTLYVAGAFHGSAGIKGMHNLATGILPRDTQWDLDILQLIDGTVVPLSQKQLYNMNRAFDKALDPRADDLTDDERTLRKA